MIGTRITIFGLTIIALAMGFLIMGSNISEAQESPQGCPIGGHSVISCPVATDNVIRESILSRFAGSVSNYYNYMDVYVANGVVTLNGQVNNESTRDLAILLASTVRGVVSIVDQISVASINSADAALVAQVRDRLRKFPINSQLIEVNANDGVIELSGMVPSEDDRESAAMIAESVVGVTSVYNNLVVNQPFQSF